jgi:uncharacterized protein HemX
MKQLLLSLAASVLALALNGVGYAAEKSQGDPQTGTQKSQAQRPSDGSQSEEEYQAALKQCDSMQGAEKQKCIQAVKKQHGQM